MRLRPRAAGPAGALAWARAEDGTLVAGTRTHLTFQRGDDLVSVPWEGVERADWDREEQRLRVVETAAWGEVPRVHLLRLPEPGLMLELLRERVSASVVLQRYAVVRGSGRQARGVRVVGRRTPHGRGSGGGEVAWFVEYDEGLDPADEAVRRLVEAELAQARAEIGL